MAQIDERRGDENRDEGPFAHEEHRAPAEFLEDGVEKQRGQRLDDAVTRRNLLMAFAAAPAKREIAEDGNIVVPGDALLAVHTGARRKNNRLTFGQPDDDHVQEAADQKPETDRDEFGHERLELKQLGILLPDEDAREAEKCGNQENRVTHAEKAVFQLNRKVVGDLGSQIEMLEVRKDVGDPFHDL